MAGDGAFPGIACFYYFFMKMIELTASIFSAPFIFLPSK